MNVAVELSEDGLELTVRVVQPDGNLREMVVTRAPEVGPFDEETIAKVAAAAEEADRIQPGEKRTTRRLTQRALADRAGLTHSAISRWEYGDRTPTRASVAKLAVALELDAAGRVALMRVAGYVEPGRRAVAA